MTARRQLVAWEDVGTVDRPTIVTSEYDVSLILARHGPEPKRATPRTLRTRRGSAPETSAHCALVSPI